MKSQDRRNEGIFSNSYRFLKFIFVTKLFLKSFAVTAARKYPDHVGPLGILMNLSIT